MNQESTMGLTELSKEEVEKLIFDLRIQLSSIFVNTELILQRNQDESLERNLELIMGSAFKIERALNDISAASNGKSSFQLFRRLINKNDLTV